MPGDRIDITVDGFYRANAAATMLVNGIGVFADFDENFYFPQNSGWTAISTLPSGQDQEPTNILEDFFLTPNTTTSIIVPEEATQLLFSVNDAFYRDNINTGEFRAVIKIYKAVDVLLDPIGRVV